MTDIRTDHPVFDIRRIKNGDTVSLRISLRNIRFYFQDEMLETNRCVEPGIVIDNLVSSGLLLGGQLDQQKIEQANEIIFADAMNQLLTEATNWDQKERFRMLLMFRRDTFEFNAEAMRYFLTDIGSQLPMFEFGLVNTTASKVVDGENVERDLIILRIKPRLPWLLGEHHMEQVIADTSLTMDTFDLTNTMAHLVTDKGFPWDDANAAIKHMVTNEIIQAIYNGRYQNQVPSPIIQKVTGMGKKSIEDSMKAAMRKHGIVTGNQ